MADLLSYATSEQANKLTSLQEEILQIHNIIELQKMRYDNRQNFSFEVNFDTQSLQVIPLVLISLVENFFRHDNLLKDDYRAKK